MSQLLDIATIWPGTILGDHRWPLGTVMRWRLRFRELQRPRSNCCTSSATQAFSRHQAGMRLRERRRQIDSSRHESVRMLTLGRSDRLKKGKGNRGSLTRARAFTGCDKLDKIFATIFLVEKLRRCNLHRMIDVVRLSLQDLYLCALLKSSDADQCAWLLGEFTTVGGITCHAGSAREQLRTARNCANRFGRRKRQWQFAGADQSGFH
jgi:hypothetical protein